MNSRCLCLDTPFCTAAATVRRLSFPLPATVNILPRQNLTVWRRPLKKRPGLPGADADTFSITYCRCHHSRQSDTRSDYCTPVGSRYHFLPRLTRCTLNSAEIGRAHV